MYHYKSINKIISRCLHLVLIMILLGSCRPPAQWRKNKSKFFKSTETKNQVSTQHLKLHEGTFIAQVNQIMNHPLLVKFNTNQTLQIGYSPVAQPSLLSLRNETYLQYLQNEISYYYYFDLKNNVLILERFEYREAPWWNFFVNPSAYLTEVFEIHGDTLLNMAQGRYTRFADRYVLNPTLQLNYPQVVNPFTPKRAEPSPQMDSLDVVQMAKRHRAYWTDNWVSPPQVKFDEESQNWTVHSTKTKHTQRGECKYTNGCTVIQTVTLVIDDQKKKVVSKTKGKSLFPNYE